VVRLLVRLRGSRSFGIMGVHHIVHLVHGPQIVAPKCTSLNSPRLKEFPRLWEKKTTSLTDGLAMRITAEGCSDAPA